MTEQEEAVWEDAINNWEWPENNFFLRAIGDLSNVEIGSTIRIRLPSDFTEADRISLKEYAERIAALPPEPIGYGVWDLAHGAVPAVEDVYQAPVELIECSDGKKRTEKEYSERLDRIASITKDAATS